MNKEKEFTDYLLMLGSEAEEMERIKKSELDRFDSEARRERYNFFRGRRNAIVQIWAHWESLIKLSPIQ